MVLIIKTIKNFKVLNYKELKMLDILISETSAQYNYKYKYLSSF